MVRWRHRLHGHEFEQVPGDSEGQGSLACCSPWSCEEVDTTWELHNNTSERGSNENNCVYQVLVRICSSGNASTVLVGV